MAAEAAGSVPSSAHSDEAQPAQPVQTGQTEDAASRIDDTAREAVRESAARRLLPPLMLPTALIGGFVASNALDLSRETLLIASMSVLICGAWWAIWRVLAETDWIAAFKSWPAWRAGQALPALPYTTDGSPSQRSALRLGQFKHWLSHELLPMHGAALLAAACAIAAAVIISAALGAQAMLLSITFVIIAQIAAVLTQTSLGWKLLRSIGLMSLPFVLGLAVMQPLVFSAPAMAETGAPLLFALAVALTGVRGSVVRHVGFAVVITLFLALRHTIGAFVIALLWLPVALLPGLRTPRWWPVLALLAGAIALS